MRGFIPGLTLSGLFYREAVKPIIQEFFPELSHSAALIGSGSEVLGFDDETSTDHNWGPRVMLLLSEDDHNKLSTQIERQLSERLPREFRGYPTSFTEPDSDDNGTQLLDPVADGPIRHRIELFTLRGFFGDYLAFDLNDAIQAADWLTFSEHKLRSIVDGTVYHDDLGLQAIRERFEYYPHDVWLYLLAAGWRRIAQEEHLTGRAGQVGDELGSAMIGGRLARDIMRLCFLMEKRYSPFPKWFGTAFQQLKCGSTLQPILNQLVSAKTWSAREEPLVLACEELARMHNELAITEPLTARVSSFFNRPFRVLRADRFVEAITARITDDEVKAISRLPLIGSSDIFSDNTDLLSDAFWRPRLRRLYERR